MTNETHMNPAMTPVPEPTGGKDLVPPVPGWVAIISIILGILGLLCWGQQGIASMFADTEALQASGLDLSEANRVLAIVGYLVNLTLSILLLVAGFRANAGRQIQAAGQLRLWAWLKLASAAFGALVSWAFFHELLQMNTIMFQEAAKEAGETLEGFGEDTMHRLTIVLLVVSVAIQAIWPCVVLAIVPRSTLAADPRDALAERDQS